MFFRLKNHVFKIGEKNTTLFNDSTQKYFYVDDAGAKILALCEGNTSLDDIPFKQENVKTFLDRLVEMGLGNYYAAPVFVDRLISHSPYINKSECALSKIYMDYPYDCSLKCSYCKDPENNISFGCQTCIGSDRNRGNTQNAATIVEQINTIKPPHVIIRGGTPFDSFEQLLSMLNDLNANRITLICTGIGLSDEHLTRIKSASRNVDFVISLLGADAQEYESLGIPATVIHLQLEAMRLLQKHDMNFGIAMATNSQQPLAETSLFEYIRENFHKDISICRSQQRDLSTIPEPNRYLRPFKTNPEFSYRRRYDSCLKGTLSISSSGDVTPCPFLDTQIGNLVENRLYDVMRHEMLYSAFWERTKNFSKSCGSCGFKYTCQSCHATDQHLPLNETSVPVCDYASAEVITKLQASGYNVLQYNS